MASDEVEGIHGSERDAVDVAFLLPSLHDSSLERLRRGIVCLQARLEKVFPQFIWRLRTHVLPSATSSRVISQLAQGISWRDRQRQDFVIACSIDRLIGFEQEDLVAATSKAAGVAILSLEPIWGLATKGADEADEGTIRRWVDVTAGLLVHLLGARVDLAELSRAFRGEEPRSLDSSRIESESEGEIWSFIAEQREEIECSLKEVSDLRLEERRRTHQSAHFVLSAILMNFSAISLNIWAARPWLLPFRLVALTTTSFSAALVLSMTAEVWELGLQQSWGTVVGMSALVVVLVSALIARPQMIRTPVGRASEQIVTTNTSLALIVLLGFVATYVLLLGAILAIGVWVFSNDLLSSWAPSLRTTPDMWDRCVHAGLVAAVSLGIGSLGASLEGVERLRLIAYIDTEVS